LGATVARGVVSTARSIVERDGTYGIGFCVYGRVFVGVDSIKGWKPK
jgi:hypothetical protein